MKCIRNNWITEKCGELTCIPPSEELPVTGKWSDLKVLYKKEANNSVRRTTLSPANLHPSSFEKQKVSLVFQVFNDKTVAALIQDGQRETAHFLSLSL